MKLTHQQYMLRTSRKHTSKIVRVAISRGLIEPLQDYSPILDVIYDRRIKVINQDFTDSNDRHRSITDFYFPSFSPLEGDYCSSSEMRFFNDNDALKGFFYADFSLHYNDLSLSKKLFDLILLRHIVSAPGFFKVNSNPDSWGYTIFSYPTNS